MSIIADYLPIFFSILIIAGIFFTVYYILKSLSNKINNAELYREDTLNLLEEIRNELQELNKKNSLK
ncbi:hypothetical protein ACNQGB_05555 [Flavobacterium sp. XS1P32]|uniref:hypothetical protein n=1 Tax=unclassified Flavobacterium TaxID=196869 RepID=UPI003AAC5F4C